MSAIVVVGAQWGDEGKGKIIDILAQDSDYVVSREKDIEAWVNKKEKKGRLSYKIEV